MNEFLGASRSSCRGADGQSLDKCQRADQVNNKPGHTIISLNGAMLAETAINDDQRRQVLVLGVRLASGA